MKINKFKKVAGIVIIVLALTSIIVVGSSSTKKLKSDNKIEKQDIGQEAEEVALEEFEIGDLILPSGLNNKKELIKYSQDENLLRKEYLQEPLKISEYVEVMHEYVDLAFDGYLSAFTEEEIDNDDIVSINHFTRTVSSILENFVEKEEYSEKNLLFLIEEYGDYFTEDTPECRVKKTIHLIQNGIPPINYNNEIVYDKALTEIDIANMLIKVDRKIEFMESDYDLKDCKPCWEEESGYEVKGR